MIARRLLELGQVAVPSAKQGVVVLAYHLVDGGTRSPVDVSRSAFEAQLEFLKDHFDVVTLDAAMAPGHSPSERPVAVITFDDAFGNFRDVAWPILARFGFPVLLYVPVAFVAGEAAAPIRETSLPPCGWDDLRAMQRDGVEIGSHTVHHVNLTRAPTRVVDLELAESRRILEDRIGVAVNSFCYPQAKWSARVARRVLRHYRTGVIAGGRRAVPGRTNPACIPRFPVRRDLSGFASMVRSRAWLPEAAADLVRQWIP